MNLSLFGQQLGQGSGIETLMKDLGHALADSSSLDPLYMLGGGQPAHIPEVHAYWESHLQDILKSPTALAKMLAHYEPPQGNPQFLKDLSELLRKRFHWPISEKNIAITAGGQTAFFLLFNALAGFHPNGEHKKILFPLVPEYIGYANQGLGASNMLQAHLPHIKTIGAHQFKYQIDFDQLTLDSNLAALCVSRPTNPSGNILTDEEINRLSSFCQKAQIPLIIDNAYGAPFPGILFTPITPIWDEHIILTLSLSKLGLPGTRTGIVIASEPIINMISSMTAITGLANNNIGQHLVHPLVSSEEIFQLSNEVIQPFYAHRSQQALAWAEDFFDPDLPYRIHLSEGAFFHWYWFEGLPITAEELYKRLKKRRVLIVPGHYFFFGLSQNEHSWPHMQECIRVSFTMEEHVVREGLRILAEEVKKAYSQKSHSERT